MARILIIDDEDLVRFTLRKMLESEAHEVIEANDGEEGIVRQKAQPSDLVIMDIVMPNKEGIETIREFVRLYPDVPIIAISGGGQEGNLTSLETALKTGAKSTIAKPFTQEDLIDHVNACL